MACGILGLSQIFRNVSLDDGTNFVNPDNIKSIELPSPLPALGANGYQLSIKDNMIMLYIPAGDFTMGSNFGDNNQKPVHNIYLNSYWIDQTEVTNGMYEACVLDRVCSPPSSNSSSTRDSYFGNPEYDNYPVTYVSWEDANTYCSWRENGSRLPTEAEWEKAARGTDGRIYPWGDTINCTFTNFNECIGDTTSVDSYSIGQSVNGVYNMAGNVWEWVADWYSETYYQNTPFSNPLGPETGEFRVLRGGSWLNLASSVSTINRNWYDPMATFGNLGFRCVTSKYR